MKFKKPRGLGGRSLADKVKKELKHLPADERRELGAELERFVREMQGEGRQDPNANEEDRELFIDAMRGQLALSAVRDLIADLRINAPLVEQIEDIDGEYEAGKMYSPVNDSFFLAWSLVDYTDGRKPDTVGKVAISVLPFLEVDADLIAAAKQVVESRLGVYVVKETRDPVVGASRRHRVEELVTGETFWMQFVHDFDVEPMATLLMRVTPMAPRFVEVRQVTHVAVAMPYALHGATSQEWLDYFGRQASRLGAKRLDAKTYEQIMRGAGDPLRWLDFVHEAFAGLKATGEGALRGIPDQPDSFPDPDEEDVWEEGRFELSPGASGVERADYFSARVARMVISFVLEDEAGYEKTLSALNLRLTLTGVPASSGEPMVVPILAYVGLSAERPPLADRLTDIVDLDEPTRQWIASARAGVLSAFEVRIIDEDETTELEDLLSGEVMRLDAEAAEDLPAEGLVFAFVVEFEGSTVVDRMVPFDIVAGRRDEVAERLREFADEGDRTLRPGTALEALVAWYELVSVDMDVKSAHDLLVCKGTFELGAVAEAQANELLESIEILDPSPGEPFDVRFEPEGETRGNVSVADGKLYVVGVSQADYERARDEIAARWPVPLVLLEYQERSAYAALTEMLAGNADLAAALVEGTEKDTA